MNSSPNQLVVDVGGGKSCPFAKRKAPDADARIVAVDVSADELKGNLDVDTRVVADATQGLPFQNSIADLVVSRSVLEHFENVPAFVRNAAEALRRGGHFIHVFPCRFAPFAVMNRAFPPNLSRKLLRVFVPASDGVCGFRAFYDRCYYSAMRDLLLSNDFEIVEMKPSYYQSPYLNFFVPLYLLSALYEMLLQAFGLKDLCAYLLVVARKN